MMTQKSLDALESAIYVARQQLAGTPIEDDDQRIRASGLYDEWAAGNHAKGAIYNAMGQTWECYQTYNNAVYPDIAPGSPAWFTYNRPLHGKCPETARPWVQPTHSEDIYRNGECMVWIDGTIQRCTAPYGTDHSPEAHPAFWEEVKEER